MALLISKDPIFEKFGKHLRSLGNTVKPITDNKLDFEFDYKDAELIHGIDGIGGAGALTVEQSPIDYFHIVKKQEWAKCDFAVGGRAGMGVHLHSWFKIRFFLSFPDPITIGPINIGTVATIRKGLIHSKVEEFFWNGYQKLTTLPPGLIRDNLVERLDSDQRLKQLIMKNLIKERVITIAKYVPPELACIKKAKVTNSKIMIESKWKLQKDLFFDKDTLEMYNRMGDIVKKTVYELKYHLK